MNSRHVARTALLIALTAVATLAIRIPNPATQGYINLGDTMIFTVALLFGGRAAGLAGGIGSALADALGGYFIWAPWTLAIKGLEGVGIGVLASKARRRFSGMWLHTIEAMVLILGGLWMIAGYYLAGSVLLGAPAALTEIPGNVIQASVGLAVALPLSAALRRQLNKE